MAALHIRPGYVTTLPLFLGWELQRPTAPVSAMTRAPEGRYVNLVPTETPRTSTSS
jgi:hypothetical protein